MSEVDGRSRGGDGNAHSVAFSGERLVVPVVVILEMRCWVYKEHDEMAGFQERRTKVGSGLADTEVSNSGGGEQGGRRLRGREVAGQWSGGDSVVFRGCKRRVTRWWQVGMCH